MTEKRLIKISKCFIVSAASCLCDVTVTNIIAMSSKKRLDDLEIVVQFPAGTRDSFQKFPHHFSSSSYCNLRRLSVHFACNIVTCLVYFCCRIPRFSRGTGHSWSILKVTWHQHKSCTRMYPGRWQWNITSPWFWSCFTCGWAEVLYCKWRVQVLLCVCCTDSSIADWQLLWDWKFSQWCR